MTKYNHAFLSLLVGCVTCSTSIGEASEPASPSRNFEEMKIWFTQPATKRSQTLPLGNGRIGALVFGGVETEKIHLSEETLWAGYPEPSGREGASKHVPNLTKLLTEGKFDEAQDVSKEMLLPYWPRRQEMMGELYLNFANHGEVSDYRRELSFDSAVAKVSYKSGGATFTRNTFVSVIDQALIMTLDCDQPGRLTFDVNFARELITKKMARSSIKFYNSESFVLPQGQDTLVLRGTGDPVKAGLKFETQLKITPTGGKMTTQGKSIHVEGADRVVLILTAATNFKKGTVSGPDPAITCQQQLAKASKRPYRQMLEEHMDEHRELFRRATLDLGTSTQAQRALPTDERVSRINKTGERDVDLEEQMFHMGRYLLINSSRPGTQAATLHGIWPGSYGAKGYNCAYHLDINISENYWPAELTGLGECHGPLIDLIEDLLPNARKTANDVFGCSGAVCALNVDGWLNTHPFGMNYYAMQWIGGMGWITQDVWEHYAFNGDKVYLRNRAWPIMKAVAEFYLDYSITDPQTGKLMLGPSGSPENGFVYKGKRTTVDYGISIDQEIAYEIYTNCLRAAKDLGIDDAFTVRVKEALPRLALPRIAKDGRLMEWREEREEDDPRHRHVSHLYGFHPGQRITKEGNPEEAAAVRKSLVHRLTGGKGDFGPGGIIWQRGWMLGFWARFQEPENFYKTLLDFMKKGLEPNLCKKWGARPYCMDGNGAFTAGMVEALLQSHNEVIHLLPSLPKEWNTGSFMGLRARGGVSIDANWSPDKLKVTLTSARGGTFQVRYLNSTKTVKLSAGMPMTLQF
ncbi:glycoside hydrolase family 95 protein [Verrucomicrobiaceae bacterium N1E253]|uniref:Glycoside hydrolase family 95 protein n=1 Tax=Oceaniferula marina TaxID=2748318 RepID=A0A851GC04_9BACT|nr:glycoside hydrolase family 95 protein [Oceaniferula marina]NWK55268.1 glycoside hydrolase family 95 protein [Oceaniferula marina]